MTVNGDTKDTFKDVCSALGLLQDDNEWHLALAEGAPTMMCNSLRELYETLLRFSFPHNPNSLFEQHYTEWTDDIHIEALKKGITLNDHQLRTIEPNGCVALAMATTGIAANLLNLGRI